MADGAGVDLGLDCDADRLGCSRLDGPGRCSDLGVPSVCADGVWVCPEGSVLFSACGQCIGPPPPGCGCSGGVLQCFEGGQPG